MILVGIFVVALGLGCFYSASNSDSSIGALLCTITGIPTIYFGGIIIVQVLSF